MRYLISAVVALLAVNLVFAAPSAKREPDSLTDVEPGKAILAPIAKITDKRIDECSGLAWTGGAYWAENDSGADSMLFRSTHLDFHDAEAFEVPGADNLDWEDLAVWDGDILVCDFGDNRRLREDVAIYRVRYVAPTADKPARVERLATWVIKYPDAAHDAEAACVIDGKLHIITKARDEKKTIVYRFDELKDAKDSGGKANVPASIGELELPEGDQVTSADYDAESGTLLLLTYTHILQYHKDSLKGPPKKKTLIAARQCEAICFKGRSVLFCNEQRDVYQIDDFLSREYASMLPQLGKANLPKVKESFEVDGSGEAWANFRAEVPLKGGLDDEHLRWLIAGENLMLHGKVRYEGEFKSTRDSGTPGSGMMVMFGSERNLTVKNELHLLVGDNGQTGVDIWKIDMAGADIKLKPLDGCKLAGKVKNGVFTFEAAVPLKAIFGEKTPDTFLFNALGCTIRPHGEALFSGLDYAAVFRPYLWGDVTVK